jgi:hypothetical protein
MMMLCELPLCDGAIQNSSSSTEKQQLCTKTQNQKQKHLPAGRLGVSKAFPETKHYINNNNKATLLLLSALLFFERFKTKQMPTTTTKTMQIKPRPLIRMIDHNGSGNDDDT